MKRPAYLLIALLLASPPIAGRAGAQTKVRPDVASFDAYTLARIAAIFQDSDQAEIRTALGAAQVPATAPTGVIGDADVCDRLGKAALGSLDRVYKLKNKQQAKEVFASQDVQCFRVGPYYAVLLSINAEALQKAGLQVSTFAPLMVFRNRDQGGDESASKGSDDDKGSQLKNLQFIGYVNM